MQIHSNVAASCLKLSLPLFKSNIFVQAHLIESEGTLCLDDNHFKVAVLDLEAPILDGGRKIIIKEVA